MKRTEEPPTLVTASTDGLILSTGNLYVTHHDAATASVWRAAQSALPTPRPLIETIATISGFTIPLDVGRNP